MLDVKDSMINHTSQYWIFLFLLNKKKKFIYNSISTYNRFKWSQNFIKNVNLFNKFTLKKFTISHSITYKYVVVEKMNKKKHVKLFQNRPKVTNKIIFSKNDNKILYHLLTSKRKFNERYLRNLYKHKIGNAALSNFKNEKLWSLFNINFIKKERLYTKLKYSRTPQYDIVSGGVAAIFAGFLGFLICEKFGFELLDSGDFYFLFMYLVFFFFLLRLLIKLITIDKTSWHSFSYKWLYMFYRDVSFLTFLFVFKK